MAHYEEIKYSRSQIKKAGKNMWHQIPMKPKEMKH